MTSLPPPLQRLLAIDAYPALPFAQPRYPGIGDYPRRTYEVVRARWQRRNPPPPTWRERSVATWQRQGEGPGPANSSARRRPLIYAVAAVWNEEDIIHALVVHLLSEGVDRVFVIDDQSDDATREEATAAGGDVIAARSDGVYSEAVRSARIRELVAKRTDDAGGDIWWLVVDADEFPRGPGGETIRDLVERTPAWVDLVGSRVLDHVPREPLHFEPRTSPLACFPLARWYRSAYCPRGHWKHSLMRVRVSGDVAPMPGHHTVATGDGRRAREYEPTLLTHHFPMRDRERTEAKLQRAATPGSRYGASPDSFTRWRVAQRLAALDDLYAGRYERVPSGFPGDPRVGIAVSEWQHLVPASERQIRIK